MILISRLRQAVAINEELQRPETDLVSIFTIYNELHYIDAVVQSHTHLAQYNLSKLESLRNTLIEKVKNNLRISDTQANTPRSKIQC